MTIWIRCWRRRGYLNQLNDLESALLMEAESARGGGPLELHAGGGEGDTV